MEGSKSRLGRQKGDSPKDGGRGSGEVEAGWNLKLVLKASFRGRGLLCGASNFEKWDLKFCVLGC